ncbi:tyrosine-type recombinase/integrase [Trueperella pyogenes]|uniref:tyrosine-type recombinase/integrase n=1 Tax=Trueperella pyogenes TaxID=1661 RepID=UPI00339D4B65
MRELFGSIVTRNGRHHGRYRHQGKEYYTPTRRTKTEVRNDLTQIHATVLDGTWQPPHSRRTPPTRTLRQWHDQWMRDLELAGYSPNTLRSYKTHWRAHILPKLGESTDMAMLTTGMIEDFLRQVQADTSLRTAGNVARSLSAGLNAAHDKGQLEAVPAFPKGWMKRPTARRTETITYTADQLDALIAAAQEQYRAAILLGSYAFLRSGEVAALRRNDITDAGVRVDEATKTDPGGRTVIGPPKSEAGYRTVPIVTRHQHIITEHLERFVPPAPTSLLWATRDGGPVRSRVLLTALHAACETTGLPKGRFHDLRHSGLTLYGQAGATLAELMAAAGHSDVGAAMIYQHAGRERAIELVEKMGF